MVKFIVPLEPILYSFRVLKNFYSNEFKSEYLENGIYHVREGNDKLHDMVTEWDKLGRVEILDNDDIIDSGS